MKLQSNSKFLLLIYAIGIALAVGAVALLFQLDNVVNSVLYGYGLQFSLEWATPYWAFIRLTMGLLACIVGLNLFLTAHMILSYRATPPVKSQALPVQPAVKAQQKEVEKEKKQGEDGVEITALPMVCNKCGKVFTQPLSMFDFKTGKPRLVNACPYCNAVLAVSGNSKMT